MMIFFLELQINYVNNHQQPRNMIFVAIICFVCCNTYLWFDRPEWDKYNRHCV